MIFPNIFRPQDLSKQIVLDNLATIRDEVVKQDAAQVNKAVDFYNNIQNSDDYLKQYGHESTEIPLQTINITKKIIDKISLLYKKPPDRNNENYLQWAQENKSFDISLKVAERFKKLTGGVLYRPVYLQDIGWRFFIDYEFKPHFVDGDPLNPVAYSIPIKHDVTNTNAKTIIEDWHIFVSDKLFFWFSKSDSRKVKYFDWAPNGEHNLGLLPVVFIRNGFPVDRWKPYPANDLIESNQAINVNLNNLNLGIQMQAFDQPFVTGVRPDEAKEIQMGPTKIITLGDSDATVGSLGFSPKLAEIYESIKFEFEAIHRAYNVNVDWSMSGDVSSGFALTVKNIDLMESREDDIALAQLYEQQIYDIVQAQQEAFKLKGPKLTKGEKLQVVFSEMNFPINEDEDRKKIDWELTNNATTVYKYMMNKYNMSEEDAKREWAENKAINEELTPRQAEIKKAFDVTTNNNK